MYIVPGVDDQPDTLVWLSKDAVNQTLLEAAPEAGGASPPPSTGASASPSTSASP
jgi:hypothetical protein